MIVQISEDCEKKPVQSDDHGYSIQNERCRSQTPAVM